MPYLDHNGFISYWTYFDSCSSDSTKNNAIISFEFLSECAVGFFSKYLKSDKSIFDSNFFDEETNNYIQPINQNYSRINTLCNTLLDNDSNSANSILEQYNEGLFGGANQVNILARMFSDNDIAVWLYQKGVEYHPESWEAYYNLGYIYKVKGDTLLAKKALLVAKELNPENTGISDLLSDL